MTVVISNAVKDTRAQDLLDAIDADVGAADLQIGTTGFVTTLVTIPLNDPAGSVLNQAIQFGGMPRIAAAAASGTAAEARIRTALGTVVISGLTVGTSGTDVILNTTAISSGQNVQIDSATITEG